MTRRRGRTLTPPEIAVWRTVAETVPLRMPGAVLPTLPEPLKPATDERPHTAAVPPPASAAKPSPASRRPVPLPDVERPLRKRVASGRQAVEGSLDLHGLRQGEAHARLHTFLTGAHREGRRLVLVVTGKGRSGGEERGVLRRLVPLWLAEPGLAPIVVAFGAAGRTHGGEGALLIHLRNRNRHPRS